MARRSPRERWQQHILEGFIAFKVSGQLKKLRRRGLKALGRTKMLTSMEWWQASGKAMQAESYRAFQQASRKVGEHYGLNQWTVEMACLLRGYRPEAQPFVIEAQWPAVRVVTDVEDNLFTSWLLFEARQLGFYVVQRQGSVESSLVAIPVPARPEEALTKVHRPARDRAFGLRVETPAAYPPEAAAELHRQAQQVGRELLRRLGYRAPRRLRPSGIAMEATKLRLGKSKLGRREAGDIAEDVHGEGAAGDPKLRKLVKDRRHKVHRRFEGRYGADA
jgi:hypothetical protein